MAREVYQFSVSVPAGTPIATPQLSDLTMPPRVITNVHVRVPPGPRGEVGFRIGSKGVSIIPTNGDQWVITDDEVIDWPLEDAMTSGGWQLIAYNTGALAHTLYVRFLANLTEGLVGQLAGTAPLAAASVSAGITPPPAATPELPPIELPPPPAIPPAPVPGQPPPIPSPPLPIV